MSTLDLFKDSLPSMLSGLSMTLKITIISLIIAFIIGIVFGLMIISKKKVFKYIAVAYVDIIRGTPLIVQAFFIYFGLPGVLNIKIDPFTAGVIAVSLNSGAYMAEIFRGGILAIDKGQMEAARSLGLPYHTAMAKIILPQAIRQMIPSIINQFIIALKDTSILSVIGIKELTQSGEIIISSTYRAFEIWGMVAVFYFVIITAVSLISRKIERRLAI